MSDTTTTDEDELDVRLDAAAVDHDTDHVTMHLLQEAADEIRSMARTIGVMARYYQRLTPPMPARRLALLPYAADIEVRVTDDGPFLPLLTTSIVDTNVPVAWRLIPEA